MNQRHLGILLSETILAREWLEHHPISLLWMRKGYSTSGLIVAIWDTAHVCLHKRTSRLVWMCNGYTSCGRIDGTTLTGTWVSPASSVKFFVNGQWIYGMWRIVATTGTGDWEWRRVRQDYFESDLDFRHVASLLAQRLLAPEWGQSLRSRLLWKCNGYPASGHIVDTIVNWLLTDIEI